MKITVSAFFLLFALVLSAAPEEQYFTVKEEIKKEKFYYPVLTLNTEIGQRFSFEPLDDLAEDDFEIIDSYNFKLGYYKIMQQITKKSKMDFTYSFNNKEYDIDKDLNNNSGTLSFGLLYEILPDLTGDISLNYREKNFIFDNDKDNFSFLPGAEFKLKPRKETLIGLKYVFVKTDFQDNDKNSNGNRVLLYIQESFYDGRLRLRGRYRGENRDYSVSTGTRKDSTKHSFAVTAQVDFN